MESKPGFDDDFKPKRRRSSPLIRSIGWMTSAMVVGGVAFSVTADTGKSKNSRRGAVSATQKAVPNRPARPLVARARDPFVVVASPKIDAGMVKAAPAGIDEAMVIDPDRNDRQSGAVPGVVTPLIPVPGSPPGQIPYYVVPPGSSKPATPP